MDVPLAHRQKSILRRLLRKYALGARYLELGCGDGFTMELFAALGMTGAGVDLSAPAIRIALSKNLPGAHLINEDFLALRFHDEPLIVMLHVLNYFEDDRRILRLLNSFLRPSGFLVLGLPAHSATYGPHDRLSGYLRRYDRADTAEKLGEAGFEVLEFLSIGFPVANIYTWVYNRILKCLGQGAEVDRSNMPLTGIRDRGDHFPKPVQLASNIVIPPFRLLIRLDRPFQRTDLGNNYLILARKVKEVAISD